MDANTIVKYKRREACWICPECETENRLEMGKCILCGRIRTDDVPYVRAWSAEDEARENAMRNTGYYNQPYQQPPVATAPYADRRITPYGETSIFKETEGYELPPKKKSNKGLIIGIVATACVISIVALAVLLGPNNEKKYKEAMSYYNSAHYEEALEKFEQLPDDYKNVSYMIEDTKYNLAVEYLENGNIEDARYLFEELGDFSDSESMILQCDYMDATALLEAGDYDGAKTAFSNLGSYSDSANMVKECDYQKATEYYNDGEYTEAMELFKSLGYYSNSTSMFNTVERALINENIRYGYYTEEEDMIGNWKDSSGNYANYTYNYNGSVHVNYSLPYTSGSYFKVENGVHYHGQYSWTKQWIFEYVSYNQAKVYDYKDGQVYVLTRYSN